jgi:predicted Zn-dependent peptidase
MTNTPSESSEYSRQLVLGRSLSRFVRDCFALALLFVVHVSATYADVSSGALSAMAEKVRFFTLRNGLRVVMYNRGTAPVFAGAVVVRVGGSDELPGETGISHMFEHMAFKGTKTIGTKDYARERELLERLEVLSLASDAGNSLSPDQQREWEALHTELKKIWESEDFTRRYDRQGAQGMNATTDKEFTKYFVNLPRSAFEFWCRTEADRLISPVMRQFYQERDVVLEERRMRFEDDPVGKLYELLLGVAYQRHTYRAPVIGYERDIRRLSAARLEEFRRKYYVPSNTVVSVVGRVNPDEDIKVIDQYFGDIPAGPPPRRDHVIDEGRQEGERRIALKIKMASQVILAYKKPNYPHSDDTPISVMNEILSGGFVSPLYTELVKRKQLVAGISSEEGPGLAYPNLFMFIATVKSPHVPDQVIEAFDGVIEKFKKQGPTAEQLEMAKRSIGMSYLEQLRSNQGLALDLASSELLFGSWRTSVDWYDKVMRVTTEDVRRVAREYLISDQRTIATIEQSME